MLSKTPLIAKDDGKKEPHGGCEKHTVHYLYRSFRFKKEKEKKEYVSAYMVLLSGCIFETRLTERQKCADAGGRGSFLPHEFLHSVHS